MTTFMNSGVFSVSVCRYVSDMLQLVGSHIDPEKKLIRESLHLSTQEKQNDRSDRG